MNKLQARAALSQDEPLVGAVIHYILLVKRLFEEAKQPGATEAVWAPLAELVAVNEFKWVNPSYEEQDWSSYITFMNQWAHTVKWESVISRMHQWQNIVYVEHVERCMFGDVVDVGGSLTVFEFNSTGKVRRMSIYLQHAPSLGL